MFRVPCGLTCSTMACNDLNQRVCHSYWEGLHITISVMYHNLVDVLATCMRPKFNITAQLKTSHSSCYSELWSCNFVLFDVSRTLHNLLHNSYPTSSKDQESQYLAYGTAVTSSLSNTHHEAASNQVYAINWL